MTFARAGRRRAWRDCTTHPLVRDAERVVRAAKFGPLGDRSIAGGLPHLQFRTFPATETISTLNEATMVVIMIELVEALAAVDEIAAIEGVDLLLIGTNDLCRAWHSGSARHDKVRDCLCKGNGSMS